MYLCDYYYLQNSSFCFFGQNIEFLYNYFIVLLDTKRSIERVLKKEEARTVKWRVFLLLPHSLYQGLPQREKNLPAN
jgi:hypothetical protein